MGSSYVITIIDNNKIQLADYSSNIVGEWKLKEKLEAFNYNVIEINGHDFNEIEKAFTSIKKGRANVIIANTIKGKGISFMEDKIQWHSKKMDENEYNIALEELEKKEAMLNV